MKTTTPYVLALLLITLVPLQMLAGNTDVPIQSANGNWVFIMCMKLAGGLALFLFGMNLMGTGLTKSAGQSLRTIMNSLTSNRFTALFVGTFVTMIVQSSSATVVMLVSFVNAGLMSFPQTIAMILGASIGTTITAQLIAFKLTDYALLFVALGAFLHFFVRNQNWKFAGESILGFGLLFYGMFIMSEAMYPMRSYEPFIQLILSFNNPLLAIATGALLTAVVQSSSAFIGILIILSMQGLLSLEASIALVFGANIGTAITAIIASINTKREAKQVALAQTIFKFVGMLIFAWWIPGFADLIRIISPETTSLSASPRQIANAHTVYNIVITLIAFPFVNLFAKMIASILPLKAETEEQLFRLKYLDDSLLDTPQLAIALAKQEVIRMAFNVKSMARDIEQVFTTRDLSLMEKIALREKKIDFLRDKINPYLIKISQGKLHQRGGVEVFQIMYTLKEFEQIADIISTNMVKEATKYIERDVDFSQSGKQELQEYHQDAVNQIILAIEVFSEVNLEKAATMKAKYKKHTQLARELELHHYRRLQNAVEKSLQTSNIHIELINMLRLVSEHATNVGRILLDWTKKNDAKQQ